MPDWAKNHALDPARKVLLEGSRLLGIELSAAQCKSFQVYLAILLAWNSKINLTSLSEPALIVRRHFIDSLAAAPYISPAGRLVDIGSGAGFPGLPLKIAFPEKEVVLVESRRKRVSFLKEVVRRLELEGIDVIEGRADEMDVTERGRFTEAVVRALGKPELFLRLAHNLLLPGGKALILHGPRGEELFHRLQATVYTTGFRTADLKKFTLPLGDEKRTLLIFTL